MPSLNSYGAYLQPRQDVRARVARAVSADAVCEGLLRTPSVHPSAGVASPRVLGGPVGVGRYPVARSVGLASIDVGVAGVEGTLDPVGGGGCMGDGDGGGPPESGREVGGLQIMTVVSTCAASSSATWQHADIVSSLHLPRGTPCAIHQLSAVAGRLSKVYWQLCILLSNLYAMIC